MRNFAWRLRYSFSSALQARLATQREAVRFEAQNISWTQQELNYHSDAVARGLRALGLQSGDKLMLKLSPGLQSEIITSRLAAARLGAEIVRSKASTSQDFATELQDKKPAGVIFDPTLKLGEGTLGDQLSRQFPTLNKLHLGQPFKCNRNPQLKFLIQTGHYTIPGVYKWRNILNYAPNEFSPLESKELETLAIPESDQPIVIADANCNKAFKAGLANVLKNGRYVIYTDKAQLKSILQKLPSAQVFASGELEGLLESVTLLVPKGSTINSSHRNRVQL